MTAGPVPETSKATVSVQKLAKDLGVSDYSIYRAVEQGQIQALHIGRRVLIPKAEYRRLTEPQSQNGTHVEVLDPPRPTDRLVATIADQVAAIGALRKDIRELTGLLQTVVEELTR